MPDFNIGVAGVEKLLKNLNTRKAAGPDGIPCRLLQSVAKELAPALTTLFTTSLEKSQVPTDWKHALVQPIYKKGDKSVAANYRPISLTSICCKLMEHIVRAEVTKHLESNNILNDAQHGFRKKRSCESQLILTTNDLAEELDKGGQTDTVLLDFSKAFDRVPHQRLIMKLFHYGIKGKTLAWIQNFLAFRTQQVVVEGETSSIGQVTSGVPQGSVLGPTLFLIYIDDLSNNIQSKVRLFADDTIVYRTIRNQQDAEILQEDLKRLEEWEHQWQMDFNVTKCHVLSVTNKMKPREPKYDLHGHTLEQVSNAKYLGIEINEKLSWNTHIDGITAKANRTAAYIHRNLKGCPRKIQTQCYKTVVCPILEYSSPIWDPHPQDQIRQLEMVQRRAARRICNNYDQRASASALVKELDLQTLQERRKIDKVSMIYKIRNGEIDIPAEHHLAPIGRRTRGHQYKYHIPQSKKNSHLFSFFPSAVRLWNTLPEKSHSAQSVGAFKASLIEWARTA